MEVLSAVRSGLLTVLFAIKVAVSPPSFLCSATFFFVPLPFFHFPLPSYKSSLFLLRAIVPSSHSHSRCPALLCSHQINQLPRSHFHNWRGTLFTQYVDVMDVAITAQSSARSRAYCLTSDSPRSLVPQSRYVEVLLPSSFVSVISDADRVFELWPILKWHFEFLRDAF